jgi:acetylornithine deacetylase
VIDPVSLTRELIRIPSPTGDETAVVDFMAGLLERLGYHLVRLPVTPNRDCLYATIGTPVVVLSTHLDVVPPHLDAGEDEDCLYGRGSCDAKGIAAAMVAASERLRQVGEDRVALLFVVGEETGGEGARAANQLEPKGRFLINGEPTENKLSIGQKGTAIFELTATGRAAHSAYPEEGVSAIDALLEAIARIRTIEVPTDPVLGDTTLNVGLIQGGVAANVIPPNASATLMFRTVEDAGPLEQQVRAVAGPVAVRRVAGFDPVRSPALPGWETTTVKFASDLAHLGPWGVGYQLGPGSIKFAHTATERIRKAEIAEGVGLYQRLVQQLLAS